MDHADVAVWGSGAWWPCPFAPGPLPCTLDLVGPLEHINTGVSLCNFFLRHIYVLSLVKKYIENIYFESGSFSLSLFLQWHTDTLYINS